MPISSQCTYAKKKATVLGRSMAYIEHGSGNPIVFLHGNPTSSYLWRNIMPHLEGKGRLIAPDLIGMGDSDKLPQSDASSYGFVEHRRYLDALLETLGVSEKVTLVVHDWGSALGFDWANRHREAVIGIVYMEAIVMPLSWDQWPEGATPPFRVFRSDDGEAAILEQNAFVEQILPTSILRQLSQEEMDVYRAPFEQAGEDRRPTLSWPRQIPLAGEPADVVKIVEDYGAWLTSAPVRKLFINAEPGGILVGDAREFCRSWPNTNEVTVPGIHFVQEDSPDEIGGAIAGWM